MTAPQPMRILVVTDEPLIRHIVCRLRASEGYWPLAAEEGEADFERLAQLPLSMILVNTYLPDLSGTEVVDRVSGFFPGVPELHLDEVATGAFDVDDLVRAIRTKTTGERRKVARLDSAS
jgi:CheY-like chemotaxis protein